MLWDLKKEIDNRLENVLEECRIKAKQISPDYVDLVTELKAFIVNPDAKRIRPYVANLVYRGMSGEREDDFFDIALALELWHIYLLLHDDVIDKDHFRHGRPNIIGRYLARLGEGELARHHANSAAILAGDLVRALMTECVLKSEFNSSQKIHVQKILTVAEIEVIGGQTADVFAPLASEGPNIESVLGIMRYKTASYSFIAPMRIGGFLAGCSAEEIMVFNKAATKIGLAYQIANDLRNLDSSRTDITEGKHTLMLYYARHNANKEQKAALDKLVGKNENGSIELVISIFEKTGALDSARSDLSNYLRAGSKYLNELEFKNKKAKAELMEFLSTI